MLSIEMLPADTVVLVAAVESTGAVVTVVTRCRMDPAVYNQSSDFIRTYYERRNRNAML